MFHKFEEGKDVIIEAVIQQVRTRLQAPQSDYCAEFARQFFSTVALDDLREWTVDDLSGCAVDFWSMIEKRAPGEVKIRIFNPTREQEGWQTTHTVVQVICDDMPFLVDSLRIVINRMELALHLVIHMGGICLTRGASHDVTAVLPRKGAVHEPFLTEAPLFLEIDRQTDPVVLAELYRQFALVLKQNTAVVEDWPQMCERVRSVIKELDFLPETIDANEVEESKAFLTWIEDHHFTFLGVRDYELIKSNESTILQAIPGTGLGVLRETLSHPNPFNLSIMAPEARKLTLSSHILLMSKTNKLSSVHRDTYTDYIGVKRFNKEGAVIGERRILGLYTSVAYNTNPKNIPFLRHKVALVMHNSSLNSRSHAGKVLLNILETLPRDDLIQASEEELLKIAMGIFYMQERCRIRMFARMDAYHRFVSCLVYVPKERFNPKLLHDMESVLKAYFHALEITSSTLFTESVLARIHFIIRIDSQARLDYDFKAVEKMLIEVGRSWVYDFKALLLETFDEEKANHLYVQYKNAFPAVYTTNFTPETALVDIQQIEALSDENPLGINFYRPLDEFSDHFRLKLYQRDVTIPLSDVLPIIEKLGLRAISERPYVIKFNNNDITWVNDFSLHYTQRSELKMDEMKALFQNAFPKIWFGFAENDGFNPLVLAAGLNWREVSILRMYAKYFKQIGFTFSQDYIETALNNNPAIAKKMVRMFELRFHPDIGENRTAQVETQVSDMLADLDEVVNIDEDKIIRQFIQAISETLRTNYYQLTLDRTYKNYISIKLNSKAILGVPRPHPMVEIFVYSPQFEGVHLRCAKVARGGLRWSDRREDFRTEVLGLMKAQQVKNAVIVPSGAKGGFVPKQIPLNASREEMLAEGISCYRQFIRGLLDITDNYVNNEISKPMSVVCYDDDDPYLVVAADKGTATFSDIANEISNEYGFWLGDAFASGGSVGYDHKKMGITAKGAWESVKRHFYQLGVDINTTDFTVVGIGDMAGDVFGNGMLLSNHIQLVAAFNHQHIFIDPIPDASLSFKERERLFHLPRSTWGDYNKDLISTGGGVFNRNVKSILISTEMKKAFSIKQSALEPNELITILLKAKVDLLWSAGIGTFVKAQSETNLDVGDRANDAIRINGKQLRCKTVGEGGNLGLTQLGRVEYALHGGLIYTDFIDNSAGVSCSDKEVNIKILLNSVTKTGDLTPTQRIDLLSEMTTEVALLVLRENYLQTSAISLAAAQMMRTNELQSRYINDLSRTGKIDRRLEFLPEEKTLIERKLLSKGLTTPEIAVLLCYSKIILKEAILASDVPEDPYLEQLLVSSFPKPLQIRFREQMQSHPLKREIIATRLSNIIVNEMGYTYVYRMQDETGAPVSAIVRSYMIARAILRMDTVWAQIEALEYQITAQYQSELMVIYVRLLRRISRWLLRSQRTHLDMSVAVQLYSPGIQALKNALPEVLSASARLKYDLSFEEYRAMGIPDTLAHELISTRGLFFIMDIIAISHELNIGIPQSATAYFGVGEFLELGWIRTQIITHTTESHWEALSRESLRDDLNWQQRQLTASILSGGNPNNGFDICLNEWAESHVLLIDRWNLLMKNLRSSPTLTYTMFFVAIRELLDLTQTTIQASEEHQ